MLAGNGSITLAKCLEYNLLLVDRYARSGVLYGKSRANCVFIFRLDCRPNRDRAGLGKFGGIANQIQQNLSEPHWINQYPTVQSRFHHVAETDVLLRSNGSENTCCFFYHIND